MDKRQTIEKVLGSFMTGGQFNYNDGFREGVKPSDIKTDLLSALEGASEILDDELKDIKSSAQSIADTAGDILDSIASIQKEW